MRKDFEIGFRFEQDLDLFEMRGRKLFFIGGKTNGPTTEVGVFTGESFAKDGKRKFINEVPDPKSFEGELVFFVRNPILNGWKSLFPMFVMAENLTGRFTPPTVLAFELLEQFGNGSPGKIEGFQRLVFAIPNSKNATVVDADLSLGILVMIALLIIPIAKVKGTVRPGLHINRTEPRVVFPNLDDAIWGHFEIQAIGPHAIGADPESKRIGKDEGILKSGRQASALVDDDGVGDARVIFVGDSGEISVRVGIRESSVFAKIFLIVGSLMIVEGSVTGVAAGV